MLPEHRAQRRDGHLDHGVGHLAHFHDRARRVDDPVPNYGIDLDGNVVAGDALLLLHIGGDGSKVEADLPFDDRPNQVEAGTGGAVEFPQPKDDGALVLISDADRPEDHHPSDDGNAAQDRVVEDEVENRHGLIPIAPTV